MMSRIAGWSPKASHGCRKTTACWAESSTHPRSFALAKKLNRVVESTSLGLIDLPPGAVKVPLIELNHDAVLQRAEICRVDCARAGVCPCCLGVAALDLEGKPTNSARKVRAGVEGLSPSSVRL